MQGSEANMTSPEVMERREERGSEDTTRHSPGASYEHSAGYPLVSHHTHKQTNKQTRHT